MTTPNYLVAYPGPNAVLQDWHGNAIGTWRSVTSWRTPRSFTADRMYQIEATVNGVTYTGRGGGVGLIFRGRRKAK